jgi:hypothetical protein
MSLSVVDAPEQMAVVPDIAGTTAFTVTVAVVEQPAEVVYVINAVEALVLPVTMPVTTPEEFTVAMPVLPLLHVPPVVVSPKEIVPPWHALATPVIDAGTGLTVTAVVLVQPDEEVYVIIEVAGLVLPVKIPVTTPEEFTVAIPVLPLFHVPPVVVSPNVVVAPWHTFVVPVITAGNGFTVTMLVAGQPVAGVNVILAVATPVLPVITPVTTPVAPTVATPVALLVHVPVPPVNEVVDPWQTPNVPVIAEDVFTVTMAVAVPEQPAL